MPRFNGQYTPDQGALLKVGVSASINSAQRKTLHYDALLDTGSRLTCVASTVVKDLHLERFGKIKLISALGENTVNTYLVDLEILFPSTSSLVRNLLMPEFIPPPEPGYEILIGRDIISLGTLHMAPQGDFSFTL